MQRISTTVLATTAFAAILGAQAVSPAARAALEGSSSTSYPLGRADARLQQLHADLPPTLTAISGHAYRRDAISTRGQVDAFTVDMEVTLSMSPRTPSTASRAGSGGRRLEPHRHADRSMAGSATSALDR